MKFGIISGSQRAGSQTKKVSDYIASQLTSMGHSAIVIDLASTILPHKASSQSSDTQLTDNLSQYHDLLISSDALIIATPEWGGAATPLIMSALLHAENLAAHKPALIASVSAARGGSYPVSQIRSFGFKNNHMLFIPEHIIVHKVQSVLNEGPATEKADLYIRSRIEWALQILTAYATHTAALRSEAHELIIDERFQNGMS